MANEVAQRLGYTNREAVSGKHIAMNMSLTNAIRMGLVVNPKLVSCAYSLKTDGSLDKLKGKIDQIEDVQDRNEKLKEYESLRRNVENAEGIPEILQANVKKGGKYIVFLPVVEDLEDEDGNVIGRKKGKDKIADYEKQIAEYFKESDLVPNFHSMLGEYGDKENSRRLEEFQNSNSEETEFMLVMNKANEGLHLDKLDGMIWLRPMDENSRILYLQQLGRVIYAEDPDNPTKDDDRPVIIDLVNNTLKVNWENEITEQDDIQMLNLILDWTERHDGTLPNINSTDREESNYAIMLKAIQEKYKQYLEGEYDKLNEKQIGEVQEIIRIGSQIDLWQIDLPNLAVTNRITHEKEFTSKPEGSFTLTEVLTDFAELEKKVDEIENVTRVEKFINTLVQLQEIGVDVSKLIETDTIETLAKKSEISKEKLEEIGLNPTQKIGIQKSNIAQVYRGNVAGRKPTKEQIEKLASMGVSLEKQERDILQEFIDTLAKLQKIGVDVSKITKKDTIETLAKKSGISREKLEEIKLNPTQKIGYQKRNITQEYRDKNKKKRATEEQIEELASMGISLEKQEERDTVQEFIDVLVQLQEMGVDVLKITTFDTIETLAQKSEISKEKLEEIGLNPTQKIGRQKCNIEQAYRGKSRGRKPTEEQIEELASIGISLEKQERDTVREFIDTLNQLREIGVDVSKLIVTDTIETLAKKSEISKEKLEEIGLNPTQKIGIQKSNIAQVYRGNVAGRKPTKEQIKKLASMGISLEKQEKDTVQEFIDTLAKLQKIGVDVSKLIAIDTIETLAKKSEISKEKLEEIGLDPTQKIGNQRSHITQRYRGKEGKKPPTQEQVEELASMGINLEERTRTGREIAEASISSLTDIEMSDREDAALKELVERTKEGGMNLDEQS